MCSRWGRDVRNDGEGNPAWKIRFCGLICLQCVPYNRAVPSPGSESEVKLGSGPSSGTYNLCDFG